MLAVYSTCAARVVRRGADPLRVAFHQYGFAAACTTLVAMGSWITRPPVLNGIEPERWLALIAAGVLVALPSLLYLQAIVHISVGTAATILNLIPVLGMLISVAWLGDTLTVRQLIGGAVLVICTALVSLRPAVVPHRARPRTWRGPTYGGPR
ncbi:DMT family transporter [Streptosporangiaceae bacterium NEAU-GS5]|nr:DMT family transporter [Streptosporangiaceae bacterium NEAU-GS5]